MGLDAKAHSDAHHSWTTVADRMLGVYRGLVPGGGAAEDEGSAATDGGGAAS